MSTTALSARPHVLIVDDDPMVRDALACGLADRGTIHTAATGEEACSLLRLQPIAAILLDVILGMWTASPQATPRRSTRRSP